MLERLTELKKIKDKHKSVRIRQIFNLHLPCTKTWYIWRISFM